MEIKIKKDHNLKETVITFLNKTLKVSKNSDSWKTDDINRFLIKIADQNVLENEDLEIDYDNDDYQQDPQFKVIVDLFQCFVTEFNKELVDKNNN